MCLFEQGVQILGIRTVLFAEADEEYECEAAVRRAADCIIAVAESYKKDEFDKDRPHH